MAKTHTAAATGVQPYPTLQHALRLPSILAVVGLKKSCMANFSELLTAYSAAGTASSPLCRAPAANAAPLRCSGGPGRPEPCVRTGRDAGADSSRRGWPAS
jgi:hypothetical protein